MDESLDATDREILRLLQEDGRISNAEIGRRVDMAPSAIYERIRKLEERGVIQGYTAILRPQALGYGLVAFVQIEAAEGARPHDFEPLQELPEVMEMHRVVGEDCFFLKIRVRDTDALARVLDEKIAVLPPVAATRTTIALSSMKETRSLPIPEPGADADGSAEASSTGVEVEDAAGSEAVAQGAP